MKGAWLLIFILFAHAGMAIFFLGFYQKDPIIYTTTPMPITPKTIKVGEAVYSETARCSKADYTVTTVRTLVNEIVYALPSTTVEVEKGCHTFKRLVLVVPAEISGGKYHIETKIMVPIKWLYFERTDTVKFKSDEFTIINPKD